MKYLFVQHLVFFEQRFVPIKCQTSGEKKRTKTNVYEIMVNFVCLKFARFYFVRCKSFFLTVAFFDCCKVFCFCFCILFFSVLFGLHVLLPQSTVVHVLLSVMSLPPSWVPPLFAFKTVCILSRPENRPCFFKWR